MKSKSHKQVFDNYGAESFTQTSTLYPSTTIDGIPLYEYVGCTSRREATEISKVTQLKIFNTETGEVIYQCDFDAQEEKKYMKIKFYYNCGSTYMATGVVNYRDYHDHVYYNQEKDTGLLKTDSDIEVSKSDLLAYVVYDGNTTTIVKVGNCKLNFDVVDLSKRKQKARNVPTENEWIVWEGGECPVVEGTLVDVKYRDGVEVFGIRALVYDWNYERLATSWETVYGGGFDIVAYRLSKGE